MLEIVLLWMVGYLFVSGCGKVINNYLRVGAIFDFWIGYVVLIGYLQVYHLFLPVRGMVYLFPLLLSLWGWYLCVRNNQAAKSHSVFLNKQFFGIVGFAVIYCLWLANRALHDGFIDDTGLYHYGFMKWAHEFSIVPGLGNLHGRLAFNNANLLVNAFLDPLFFQFGAVRLANGLLIAVISCQAIVCGANCYKHAAKYNSAGIIGLVLVCFSPIIFYLAINGIGMSTDIPNFIMGILATGLFLKIVFSAGDRKEELDQSRRDLWVLVSLCSAGVCIKLSFVIFGFLLCVSAFITLTIRFQEFKLTKSLLKMSWIPFSLIGIYIVRGYIQTGYPLYPATIGAINFDWMIPENYVVSIAQGIKAAARMFGWPVEDIINGWKWMSPWVEQQMLTVKGLWVVVLPLVLSVLSLIIRCRIKCDHAKWDLADSLVTSIFFLSASFWLFQAPTPRFAGVVFWFYFVYQLIRLMNLGDRKDDCTRVLPVSMCLIVMGLFVVGSLKDRSALITYPDEVSISIPSPKIKTFTTDSGLLLYVPNEMGAMAGLSWDAPLPATPNPKSELRLRTAGDLSKGFTLRED
jgi:hypothetical protein